MKENKIKIFVPYNKYSTLIKNDIFIPIHIGRALKNNVSNVSKDEKISLDDYNWLFNNMIGDDTGDNISIKNKEYFELTAIYWVWKNYDKIGNPDYIGFMLYNILFNINSNKKIYEILNFKEKYFNLLGFSHNNISNLVNTYDIIVPDVCDVYPLGLPDHIMSNYDFYCRNHIKEDLDKVINIINTDYIDYKIDIDNYFKSNKSFFFHMFIMKREVFFQYCEWLFSILFQYELIRCNRDNIEMFQNKDIYYIAERLLNLFVVHYARVKNNNLVMYANVVNVCCKVDKFDYSKLILGNKSLSNIKPQILRDDADKINIVYSSDNNYAQHCCVSMASILLNSDENSYFNFIILDGGITQKNKNKILSLKHIKKCDITFYDISKFDFSKFKLNREYISIAAYYRLAIPEILDNNIKKIIYIDCDTIVETDIKKLWNIDIENYLALVVDDECGVFQCIRLGLSIDSRYFNSGVLVFNIDKLRKCDFYNQCIKYYRDNENIITLQDQDILNIFFNNKCKFIDLNWNANSRIYLGNSLKAYSIQYGDSEKSYSKEEEDKAKYNPYIIHYTDVVKPWDIFCKHPLQKEYFEYLKFTKFKFFKFKFIFNKYIFYYKKNSKIYKVKNTLY